jgi:phosphohistidine phosphatase SixA
MKRILVILISGLLVLTCWLSSTAALAQSTSELEAWNALKQPNAIVLFRHAYAPGGGDPAGFRINDCSTQRNLNAQGRDQAKRIGQRFHEKGVQVNAVLSSQWCRTRETAQLAFPGLPKDALAFNSFFGTPELEAQQTAAARQLLLDWQGKGALVVVTHQVNITALTGIFPDSGEGIVLKKQADKLMVVGRIIP